jgi:hypothetical protein
MSAKKTRTSARKTTSKASTLSVRGRTKIVFVAPQPRRDGTKAAKNYAEMSRWVSRKKGTVDQLLSETSYRAEDYNWDLRHGNIKVKTFAAR